MSETARPAWAQIDLAAIRHNLGAIKSRLSSATEIMAVVKANAYGHGLVPTALASLEAGAVRLGVALVEEGLELLKAGVKAPIQVLSEPAAGTVDDIVENGLIPAVYTVEFIDLLNEAARRQGRRALVHVKVDTGMHRVGVPWAEAPAFLSLARKKSNLSVEGVFTHFAQADDPKDPYTDLQLERFLTLREKADGDIPLWHAANSAAAIFKPETQLDMVRLGIAIYGLQPSNRPVPFDLRPALTLKTRIGFVQELAAGEGVSYGLTYKAVQPTRIAALPIGYGDGYSRLLSNKGAVLVAGRRVPVVGNVCMDQTLIEIGAVAARSGDEVILIGAAGNERITAEEIAGLIGTINYEVVCLINNRVPRVYTN